MPHYSLEHHDSTTLTCFLSSRHQLAARPPAGGTYSHSSVWLRHILLVPLAPTFVLFLPLVYSAPHHRPSSSLSYSSNVCWGDSMVMCIGLFYLLSSNELLYNRGSKGSLAEWMISQPLLKLEVMRVRIIMNRYAICKSNLVGEALYNIWVTTERPR
jgi:hypothetical protein